MREDGIAHDADDNPQEWEWLAATEVMPDKAPDPVVLYVSTDRTL